MSSNTGDTAPLATSPGGAENVTKIRTLIVDDEPMARERVLSLLQQQPDIEVVGECADGAQALSAIERLEPELVFLDVQIPVMDGFGVIRALAPNRIPLVVFTTAYDEYALQGVRGPRARLPAEAVRQPAVPAHARARPRAARTPARRRSRANACSPWCRT